MEKSISSFQRPHIHGVTQCKLWEMVILCLTPAYILDGYASISFGQEDIDHYVLTFLCIPKLLQPGLTGISETVRIKADHILISELKDI